MESCSQRRGNCELSKAHKGLFSSDVTRTLCKSALRNSKTMLNSSTVSFLSGEEYFKAKSFEYVIRATNFEISLNKMLI